MHPTLYILSGLPASGKSTLGKMLATHLNAVYLRIDTIEQALRDLCDVKVEGEGYRLSYRIATDNLKCGNSVVADSCNPIELTRSEWEQAAKKANAHYVHIVIECANKEEHQTRVKSRKNDIDGLKLPNWDAVQNREYHEWTRPHIKTDTSGKPIEESFEKLLIQLDEHTKIMIHGKSLKS